MFTRRRIEATLDTEMEALLEKLEELRDQPDDYAAVVERVAKLQKLRSERGLQPPSWDTVLVVGANVFGVVWLARYEKENVISGKAINFVMKSR